jgi:hypothetical protein
MFIVGSPRSGTTFLASLMAPTRFGAPVETHFITKYYKKLASYGDLNHFDNFKKLVSHILKERPVMQWGLKYDIPHMYDEIKSNMSYGNLCSNIILKRFNSMEKEHWGDKTPMYIDDIDIIIELFPNAKYIYIVRDGRDVALSLLQKDWGPNNIYACAKYWSNSNRAEQRMDNMFKADNFLSLKYEDLLVDTQIKIEQIYQFLDEPYPTGDAAKLIKTTLKNNAFKWKTRLTERQNQVFEHVARKELVLHGYEVVNETTRLSAVQQSFYALHNKVLVGIQLFKLNVIDGIKIKFFGMQPFAD